MAKYLIMSACVCDREPPVMWGVEVSSGHGSREVKTGLQLSDRPLVDHIIFDTGDYAFLFQIKYVKNIQKLLIFKTHKKILLLLLFSDLPNATINVDGEDPPFFSTLVCCSLVNFA